MARSIRAHSLETRAARLRLPVVRKSVWVKVGRGLALGYRRNQTNGTWSVRVARGDTHSYWAFAQADDHEDADGNQVLDFWQAQTRARALGGGTRDQGDDKPAKLATVKQAVASYEENLELRSGDPGNAGRIRNHLPPSLASRQVAMLTARDFAPWQQALTRAHLTAAARNRVNSCLRACLNLAMRADERVTNQRVWERALAAIPDAGKARNVILPEEAVRALIAGAYGTSNEFGLLVEVCAVTGARVSQIARLEQADLQTDADPRLLMPSSKKGRGQKRVDRRPVPVPPGLVARLLAGAHGRKAEAPLLTKPSGEPWKKSDHLRLFRRLARRTPEVEGTGATINALRHSNIVRQLLAGVPIRVVAVNHDTSVGMIEKNYSRYIADHADRLSRATLLDVGAPPAGNVVRLRK